VNRSVLDKRVVKGRIVKHKHLFQIRSGWSKPAGKHQRSPGGEVTQDQSRGVVALAAQTQQVLGQRPGQIEFAAVHMVEGLPKGDVNQFRERTQLLPQFACAGIGLARLRRREAFDGDQDRA
jgi:hypothetical protein